MKPRDLALLKAGMTGRAGADGSPADGGRTCRSATGTDWPAVIARCFGLWAAGYFDRGQALWTPAPGAGRLCRLAGMGDA